MPIEASASTPSSAQAYTSSTVGKARPSSGSLAAPGTAMPFASWNQYHSSWSWKKLVSIHRTDGIPHGSTMVNFTCWLPLAPVAANASK